MLIRLLQTVCGPDGNLPINSEVDLPPARAAQLIDAKAAVAVDSSPPPPPPPSTPPRSPAPVKPEFDVDAAQPDHKPKPKRAKSNGPKAAP